MELSERKSEQLPYVIFRSLRVGDEVYAADDEHWYAFRIRELDRQPIVDFKWRRRVQAGQSPPWKPGPVGTFLCGHCDGFRQKEFGNVLGTVINPVIPNDPAPDEFALGRCLWITYEQDGPGNYVAFVSSPLDTLYVRRPSEYSQREVS